MTNAEILEKVIAVVKKTMETDNVTADTLMQDDLHIESVDFYTLLGDLERTFRIKIAERILAQVETVQDIADEVEKILNK